MRSIIIVVTAALFATPAFAQEPSRSTASVPDFSGLWVHGSIPGFEPLPSGPTSLVNRSRRANAQLLEDMAQDDWPKGAELAPSEERVSNIRELVGDYTNPILKPEAAEIVKKFGDISLAGVGYPTPRTQCWPEGVPFVFTGGA